MISVKDLKIHYGEHVAVDSLSFSVESGSVFGLIGPNGAGKTTTIKAIATLLEPTYGEISIDHISVLHQPEKARKKLGYMPDFPPVYDDLLVYEFCDLFAHAYGLSTEARKNKVKECLALTDLTDKAKVKCKTLSRGMKQRALLAKTLVHEPSVLLLDEPAANLDPKARIDLRNLLRKLASSGKTILVSSHVLSELEDLCDAIGIMRAGKMVVSGNLQDMSLISSAEKLIQIEILSPDKKLEECLAKFPSLSKISRLDQVGTRFSLSHTGDAEDAASILESLIHQGFPVSSFHRKQSKVEDLFLDVEAGRMKEEKAR